MFAATVGISDPNPHTYGQLFAMATLKRWQQITDVSDFLSVMFDDETDSDEKVDEIRELLLSETEFPA